MHVDYIGGVAVGIRAVAPHELQTVGHGVGIFGGQKVARFVAVLVFLARAVQFGAVQSAFHHVRPIVLLAVGVFIPRVAVDKINIIAVLHGVAALTVYRVGSILFAAHADLTQAVAAATRQRKAKRRYKAYQ